RQAGLGRTQRLERLDRAGADDEHLAPRLALGDQELTGRHLTMLQARRDPFQGVANQAAEDGDALQKCEVVIGQRHDSPFPLPLPLPVPWSPLLPLRPPGPARLRPPRGSAWRRSATISAATAPPTSPGVWAPMPRPAGAATRSSRCLGMRSLDSASSALTASRCGATRPM